MQGQLLVDGTQHMLGCKQATARRKAQQAANSSCSCSHLYAHNVELKTPFVSNDQLMPDSKMTDGQQHCSYSQDGTERLGIININSTEDEGKQT